jgi:hypothetical protein
MKKLLTLSIFVFLLLNVNSQICDTSILQLKITNEFPDYDYLKNNNYCYTIDSVTTDIAYSFTFTNISATFVFINAGYDIGNCSFIYFNYTSLYDNTACEMVGEGFTFDVIPGHVYTWFLAANVEGDSCDAFKEICPYYLDLTPLDINLLYFSGEAINNKIFLDWKTLSETNSNYFILYKSNGFNNFKAIARIPSHNNSITAKSYTYIDTPYEHDNYYKLTEVDYNGYERECDLIYVPYELKNIKFKIYNELGRETNLTTKGLKIIRYENNNVIYRIIAE